MKYDKVNFEDDSQAVYESFCKYSKKFKIPRLKEGTYVVSPRLVGGSQNERLINFTEYLSEKDLKKLYGKESLMTGKIKNPYAKIVLDFNGVFRERFTGKKIYAIPYKSLETLDSIITGGKKVERYCGETNSSLKANNIDSLFIHLEDLEIPTKKDLKRTYKLCYSEKKLAIFEKEFLNFANETEENLGTNNLEAGNKQYLLLKRNEKRF